MSCWQRPDWAQFFDCAYEHLAQPVTATFPFGLVYLVVSALSVGLTWLLVYVTNRIFGEYAILKPFEMVEDAIWEVGRWWWHWRHRQERQWRREREAEQAGETPAGGEERGILERMAFLLRRRSREVSRPAGTLREDEIDLDEAEKALAGRRKEGD